MKVCEYIWKKDLVDYYIPSKEKDSKIKVADGYIKAKEIVDLLAYSYDGEVIITIEWIDERLGYYVNYDEVSGFELEVGGVTLESVESTNTFNFKQYDAIRGGIALENIDELEESLLEKIIGASCKSDFKIEFRFRKVAKYEVDDFCKRIIRQIQIYQRQVLNTISKQGKFNEEVKYFFKGTERASYTKSDVYVENKIKQLEDAYLLISSASNVFSTPEIKIYSKQSEVRKKIIGLITNFGRRSTIINAYSIVESALYDRSIQNERKRAEAIKNDIAKNKTDKNKYQEPVEYFINPLIEMKLIPSDYLCTMISLPNKSMDGLRVTEYVEFGTRGYESNQRKIEIGKKIDMTIMGSMLEVDVDDLVKHALVSGVTGSGKTTTVKTVLNQVCKQGIPYLVLEPAKTEYRSMRNALPNLKIYRLGLNDLENLRINAFEFPRNMNIQTHLDYLKSVFVAAFPMYGPMPYILEQAMYKVYEDCGWDFLSGENIFQSDEINRRELFPTLSDLYNAIDGVTDAVGYSSDTQSDVKGALKVRIGSMINGAKGVILNTKDTIKISELIKSPTIIELESIGDNQEKVFLMGMILIKIYEYYISNGKHTDQLRNLLVIEEAHRLLENVQASNNNEVADMKGKAMELFNDILSEVRTYGQGILIAEQIPTKISSDVIKNTNLKIIHRTFSKDDRDILANSIGMDEKQNEHIIKLATGQAIVYHGKLDDPVKVEIAADFSVLASMDESEYTFEKHAFNIYEYLVANKKFWRSCKRVLNSFLLIRSETDYIERLERIVPNKFLKLIKSEFDSKTLAERCLVKFIQNEGSMIVTDHIIERVELLEKIDKDGIKAFIECLNRHIARGLKPIDALSNYAGVVRYLNQRGYLIESKKLIYRGGETQTSKDAYEILNQIGLFKEIDIRMFDEDELDHLCDAMFIVSIDRDNELFRQYFEMEEIDIGDSRRYLHQELDQIKQLEVRESRRDNDSKELLLELQNMQSKNLETMTVTMKDSIANIIEMIAHGKKFLNGVVALQSVVLIIFILVFIFGGIG